MEWALPGASLASGFCARAASGLLAASALPRKSTSSDSWVSARSPELPTQSGSTSAESQASEAAAESAESFWAVEGAGGSGVPPDEVLRRLDAFVDWALREIAEGRLPDFDVVRGEKGGRGGKEGREEGSGGERRRGGLE